MTSFPASDPHYFDFAATTPLSEAAAEELLRWRGVALNPSSIHQSGQRARRLLEEARARLAALLDVEPHRLIFTGSATESVNLALRGLLSPASMAPTRRKRALTSPIEHSCVNETLEYLAKRGEIEIHQMQVVESGRAIVAHRSDEGLVDLLCLMHANNETGVVQDLESARRLTSELGCAWLCDASQSFGKVPLSVRQLGADLVVVSSHKVGGPPGIALLIGPGVRGLTPQVIGGGQEDGLRGGTPSVALARAFMITAEDSCKAMHDEGIRRQELEEAFLKHLSDQGISFRVNGEGPRLPGFLNVSVFGLEAVEGVIALDGAGFRVSPGSACSTGVVTVSPVLSAMFPVDQERAQGGIRISMGRSTTSEAVIGLAAELSRIARAQSDIREIRPKR